ncbi:thiamine phosphate synthase [Sphingomonas sp. IC-11]|uniref:thiamine phosphate synthase n=1 Tax=Sphingomonas sp. IC-11 TaxID=2898528 RepID=UPI001E5FC690|nr:thiamine phosphate synthase [Sphingomonas sp. IC-11]MCD2316868.1 thiamine phosphate synthase [Sphingomonas sp. IC-11]
MRRRHPVPTLWLMTDERMGEALWEAVRRLPRGAGIVFRHHATPPAERRQLFARLLRLARARGLVLVRAGDLPMRGEMGVHRGRSRSLVTWPVHNAGEARLARQAGADVAFVSPVFGTRSHPGARGLGVRRAEALARTLPMVRIALGGMNARRFRMLHRFDGWAAIDAWLR